jgi:hypothetical protein
MGINAQASQVGTGRGTRSSVTMWIFVAAVVVVSMVGVGIVTAVRTETATPISGGAPLWNAAKLDAMEGRMLAESIRIKQAAPSGTVSVPEAPTADASTGGSSLGKRQIGSGSAVAPGGYILNGSAQYSPQQR